MWLGTDSIHCPMAYCQAEQGQLEVTAFVVGGFFVGQPGQLTMALPMGAHVHDCVMLSVGEGLTFRKWKHVKLYLRCFRMTFRMLRYGMSAVDAYGAEK